MALRNLRRVPNKNWWELITTLTDVFQICLHVHTICNCQETVDRKSTRPVRANLFCLGRTFLYVKISGFQAKSYFQSLELTEISEE